MIEAKQIRAARALLSWSQRDLAKATGLAHSSIKNIEGETTSVRRGSMALIRDALEIAGIEFAPGSGVKLKSELIAVHTGRHATAALLDTIYRSAHAAEEREVCIFGIDEAYSKSLDGESLLTEHIARLKAAGIRERILIAEGDRFLLNDPDCYRWVPQAYFCKSAPIYIIGDRIAIHTGTLKRRVIIIELKTLAHHLKRVFNFVWDHAKLPVLKDDPAAPRLTVTLHASALGRGRLACSPSARR